MIKTDNLLCESALKKRGRVTVQLSAIIRFRAKIEMKRRITDDQLIFSL